MYIEKGVIGAVTELNKLSEHSTVQQQAEVAKTACLAMKKRLGEGNQLTKELYLVAANCFDDNNNFVFTEENLDELESLLTSRIFSTVKGMEDCFLHATHTLR